MTQTTYILKTERGAAILSFDSLEGAKTARKNYQTRFTRPLKIVEQRIVEKEIEG